MFERFTEPARQAVVFAQEEARLLRHDYIGTEHILLGLLREREGAAARVLESLGITLERVRDQVLRTVGSGSEATPGQVPFTPRAKGALELALREALVFAHDYIGTEHLLLGLLRDEEAAAARVLVDLGADAGKVRDEVLRVLPEPRVGGAGRGPAHSAAPPPAPPPPSASPSGPPPPPALAHELGQALNRGAAQAAREGGRPPDVGDVLLALAEGAGGLVARALEELGIDKARLHEAIEAARNSGGASGANGQGL